MNSIIKHIPPPSATIPIQFCKECDKYPISIDIIRRILPICNALSAQDSVTKCYIMADFLPAYPEKPFKMRGIHSIRKESGDKFIVTLDRKNLQTLLGSGTYKVIKAAWRIIITPSAVLVEAGAIAKERKALAKGNLLEPSVAARLQTIPEIESISQFIDEIDDTHRNVCHFSKRADIDLFHLDEISIKPSFPYLMLIAADILMGVKKLLAVGLRHDDLKTSNILVFLRKNNGPEPHFFSKHCDINAIKTFYLPLSEQTIVYFSIEHRFIIINEMLSKGLCIEKEFDTYALDKLKEKTLMPSVTAITSQCGLILLDICILLNLLGLYGNAEKTNQFYDLMFQLLGISIPYSCFMNSAQENSAFINTLIETKIKTGSRIEEFYPKITLDDAITVLLSLSKLPEESLLPITPPPPIPDLSISYKGTPYLGPDLTIIHSLFLTMALGEKIYISISPSLSFYKKLAQCFSPYADSSVRKISSTSYIIEIDRHRKSATSTSKQGCRVWIVKSKSPHALVVKNTTLIIRKKPDLERIPYPNDSFAELKYVESTTTFFQETSSGAIKSFYLSKPVFLRGHELYTMAFPFNTSQFIVLSQGILSGLNELHIRGLTYGDCKVAKCLIYYDNTLPPHLQYSVKLEASRSIGPAGTVPNPVPFAFAPPRKKSEVIWHMIQSQSPSILPKLSLNKIENDYLADPSLYTFPVSIEDEIAVSGLVLLEFLRIVKTRIGSLKPEIVLQIESIICKLTGGYNSTNRDTDAILAIYQKNPTTFFKPPSPEIPLDVAIALFGEILSSIIDTTK